MEANFREEIDFRLNDIAVPFLWCPECDFEWRADQPERCIRCARAIGRPFELSDEQAEDLMRAVEQMVYGVNDEDDLEGIIRLLEEQCPWYDLEDAQRSQTCFMYLQSLPPTPEIEHAMDFFEFQFEGAVPYLQQE